MAKVKFGMMMTDASGKLGGQVFSKNRSGSYVRTKVTPSNPQTPAQQQIRATLGAISSAWSGLTDAQRASWNGAVNDWKKTDIFGDLKNPTGKNLFTSLNINLVSVGEDQILLAPEKQEIPFLNVSLVQIDLSDTNIDVIFSGDLTGYYVTVSATPPLSAGTSFYKGKFREVFGFTAGTIDGGVLYDQYLLKFGPVAVGQNIAFSFKVIGTNGQAGVPEVVKAIVQA